MRAIVASIMTGALLAGCALDLEEEEEVEIGEVASAVIFSNHNKVVVWQHNISWFSSPSEAERAVLHAMQAHGAAPDIFMFQECGKLCVCGEQGTFDEATGTCSSIGGPGVAHALRSISPDVLARYRFYNNAIRTIGYRADRFDRIGTPFEWGATPGGAGETYATCSTVEVGKQLSIALRDSKATPPRRILASTGHWFVSRDCACKQVHMLESNWKTAVKLRDASGTPAGEYVDLHVVGGDWNAEPSSSLPSAYRSGGACDGVGLGGDTHHDTAGTAFTFCQGAGGVSNPSTCTSKKKVDYLWARTYNGSGITWNGTPDLDANYSNDHRAIRSVFTY